MQVTNTPHIEDKNNVATQGKQRSKCNRRVPKIIVGILIVFMIALVLFGGAIAVLHLKSVQTYIIGKVTDKLEKTFHYDKIYMGIYIKNENNQTENLKNRKMRLY